MIRAERHERILAELARHGTVSAQDLSKLLAASLATVRRDIAELDARGTVKRTRRRTPARCNRVSTWPWPVPAATTTRCSAAR